MTYEEYICSPEWAERRKRVLERDHYTCQGWFEHTEDLEVHHRTYEHLGNEPLDDLITLCKRCHEALTSVIRDERYSKREMPKPEVERPTPILEKRITENVSQEFELQDCRRVTPGYAQRPISRPA